MIQLICFCKKNVMKQRFGFEKQSPAYLEREVLLVGLFDPCFADGLCDRKRLLEGEEDFLPVPECADALLPLLDLALSLDFTESLDFERDCDLRLDDCGEIDPDNPFALLEASISRKINRFSEFEKSF